MCLLLNLLSSQSLYYYWQVNIRILLNHKGTNKTFSLTNQVSGRAWFLQTWHFVPSPYHLKYCCQFRYWLVYLFVTRAYFTRVSDIRQSGEELPTLSNPISKAILSCKIVKIYFYRNDTDKISKSKGILILVLLLVSVVCTSYRIFWSKSLINFLYE